MARNGILNLSVSTFLDRSTEIICMIKLAAFKKVTLPEIMHS